MNATKYNPESDTARCIKVIETTLTRRGSGKNDKDPVRIVRQYWSFNGELLAECDPFKEGNTIESIAHLSARLAREIFKLGDWQEDKCNRIQFMVGIFGVNEQPSGGLSEDALAKKIESILTT